MPLLSGFVGGVIVQVVKIFIIDPVESYKELKSEICTKIQYYFDATNVEGLNYSMCKKHKERREDFLMLSAKLNSRATNKYDILKLLFSADDMSRAAKNLRGLANTNEWDAAGKIMEAICRDLSLNRAILD